MQAVRKESFAQLLDGGRHKTQVIDGELTEVQRRRLPTAAHDVFTALCPITVQVSSRHFRTRAAYGEVAVLT